MIGRNVSDLDLLTQSLARNREALAHRARLHPGGARRPRRGQPRHAHPDRAGPDQPQPRHRRQDRRRARRQHHHPARLRAGARRSGSSPPTRPYGCGTPTPAATTGSLAGTEAPGPLELWDWRLMPGDGSPSRTRIPPGTVEIAPRHRGRTDPHRRRQSSTASRPARAPPSRPHVPHSTATTAPYRSRWSWRCRSRP